MNVAVWFCLGAMVVIDIALCIAGLFLTFKMNEVLLKKWPDKYRELNITRFLGEAGCNYRKWGEFMRSPDDSGDEEIRQLKIKAKIHGVSLAVSISITIMIFLLIAFCDVIIK